MSERYKLYNIYGIFLQVSTYVKTVPLHDCLFGEERVIESLDDVKDIELALNEFRLVQTVDGAYSKCIKTLTTEDREYWQEFAEGVTIFIDGKKCTIKEMNGHDIYLYDQFGEDIDEASYNKSMELFKNLQEKVNEYFALNVQGTPNSKFKTPQEASDELTEEDLSFLNPGNEIKEEDIDNMTPGQFKALMKECDEIINQLELDEEVIHVKEEDKKKLEILQELERKNGKVPRDNLNQEVLEMLLKSQFEDIEEDKSINPIDGLNKPVMKKSYYQNESEETKKVSWYKKLLNKIFGR